MNLLLLSRNPKAACLWKWAFCRWRLKTGNNRYLWTSLCGVWMFSTINGERGIPDFVERTVLRHNTNLPLPAFAAVIRSIPSREATWWKNNWAFAHPTWRRNGRGGGGAPWCGAPWASLLAGRPQPAHLLLIYFLAVSVIFYIYRSRYKRSRGSSCNLGGRHPTWRNGRGGPPQWGAPSAHTFTHIFLCRLLHLQEQIQSQKLPTLLQEVKGKKLLDWTRSR